jgi:uncharacterized membrane protein YfcA
MIELPGFSDPDFAWMLGIMLISGLTHGSLGLGFAVVLTSLLALLVDMRTAILISLFPTIVINILSILHGGNWRASVARYWPLAAYAAIGSLLGTQLLILADPEPFKLLLAAIILLYLNMGRLGKLRFGVVRSAPRLSMAAFGLTAGVLAGTVNVMVPVLIIYALELGLASTAMVQVFNLCFMSGKLAQVGMFSAAGMLDLASLVVLLPLVAGAVVGLIAGMLARSRISESFYRRLLQRILFLIACMLVIDYVSVVGFVD